VFPVRCVLATAGLDDPAIFRPGLLQRAEQLMGRTPLAAEADVSSRHAAAPLSVKAAMLAVGRAG